MRYGYWLPVFGGWLRNVADEGMEPTWDYARRLAQRSEQIGYDLTLIAELFLNDIKGIDAPALDAWSTAAALAAVTQTLELMAGKPLVLYQSLGKGHVVAFADDPNYRAMTPVSQRFFLNAVFLGPGH